MTNIGPLLLSLYCFLNHETSHRVIRKTINWLQWRSKQEKGNIVLSYKNQIKFSTDSDSETGYISSPETLRTFVAVIPDVWGGVGPFLLDLHRPRLLADRGWLGEAEVQEEVEVVEGAVLPDQVSEVHLRVLSVEIDLGLAEDADDPIVGVVRPASVHHLTSVSLIVISASNQNILFCLPHHWILMVEWKPKCLCSNFVANYFTYEWSDHHRQT